MGRTKCVVLLILINTLYLNAAENHWAGARALALSNAAVSFSDAWSTFHNQAGLANLTDITTGFYYESRFNIDELALIAGSLVLPVKAGTFGISFSQFGKATYKENKIGLGFAKKLTENFDAGIQFDYFSQTFPENERAFGFATVEGGIIWSPAKNLFLGSHIFNPFAAGIETPAGKQKMPATYQIGGHYQFNDMALVTTGIQKESNFPARFKGGIEFLPVENFALRFGVSGKPFNSTAGIGYNAGKLNGDIAFSYHGNLGITPSVSVQFKL